MPSTTHCHFLHKNRLCQCYLRHWTIWHQWTHWHSMNCRYPHLFSFRNHLVPKQNNNKKIVKLSDFPASASSRHFTKMRSIHIYRGKFLRKYSTSVWNSPPSMHLVAKWILPKAITKVTKTAVQLKNWPKCIFYCLPKQKKLLKSVDLHIVFLRLCVTQYFYKMLKKIVRIVRI